MTARETFPTATSLAHDRAARVLGLALTAVDADAWRCAGRAWRKSLSPAERGALAFVALAACEPEHRAEIVAAFAPEAGPPLTPFGIVKGEAQTWAAVASRAEKKAYAAAAFLALPVADRRAFLDTFSDEALP